VHWGQCGGFKGFKILWPSAVGPYQGKSYREGAAVERYEMV